uniref:Uncharacterized protein n=1 Tax=Arundo donax TaxID=35708 RepID=A0A0A9A8C2_ARUDO
MRTFQVDVNEHELRIMVAVSRARKGYFWELIPINVTSTWKRYVEMGTERGWPLRLLAQAYILERLLWKKRVPPPVLM